MFQVIWWGFREIILKKYIYIGLGGMLGAMSRFGIKNIQLWDFQQAFPINTLLVNITGSFLLLLILTIALEILTLDADLRLGITTGFLGAYTTFSTLCKEVAMFIFNGEYLLAFSTVVISATLGLAAAYLGVVLARKIIGKSIKSVAEGGVKTQTGKAGVK